VHDIEQLDSWEPREYQSIIRGYQEKQIDQIEMMAIQASFFRVANNKPGKLQLKQIYDANKARRMLQKNQSGWKRARTDKTKESLIKKMFSKMPSGRKEEE
jgi:hypothetical protein